MLGLKFVVAKSKALTSELTSKLERTTLGGSRSNTADATSKEEKRPRGESESSNPTAARHAGEAFLLAQHQDYEAIMQRHRKLMSSGDHVAEELAKAHKRLQDQADSEAFITHHFHEIKQVREQLQQMRGVVERIASEVERVEEMLVQRTEERMAAENASFAAQQQHELERFEQRILEEKEERKRQLLQERRVALAAAFRNDLRAYQTMVYQGVSVPTDQEKTTLEETLESIDLVVAMDETQLDEFYHTDDERSSVGEPMPTSETDVAPHNDDMHEHDDEEEEKEEKTEAQTPAVVEGIVPHDDQCLRDEESKDEEHEQLPEDTPKVSALEDFSSVPGSNSKSHCVTEVEGEPTSTSSVEATKSVLDVHDPKDANSS